MTSAWPMYRAMVGVGLVCGVLIVAVFEGTRPVIARNQAEALRTAVFTVIPGAERSQAFTLGPDGGFVPAEERATEQIFAGYGADGRLAGVAFEGAGMGYQDTIRVLFGFDPESQEIIGMQVLESKETPGLGDKIEKDAGFLANFDALEAKVEGDGLAQEIVAVKSGEKTEPWQIDGITGATVSSVAIAAIADDAATRWAPRIVGKTAQLEEQP